jgi:hypothetical protein
MVLNLHAQVVSVEEATASAEAAKVKAIKDECEADLAEAMPLLEAALKALDTLTKNDITEVKGMKSPPSGEGLVLKKCEIVHLPGVGVVGDLLSWTPPLSFLTHLRCQVSSGGCLHHEEHQASSNEGSK